MPSETEPDKPFDAETERAAVWDAFRAFVGGMVETRRREECLSSIADTVVGIGMGEQGIYFNKGEYVDIINSITKETAGLEYDFEYGRHEVVVYPTASASVLSEIKVSSVVDGKPRVSSVVQMAGMVQVDGRWVVSSASCAPLVVSQESIGALPLRFAESTIAQLKGELQVDAVELMHTSIPGGMISFYNGPDYPIHFINAHMLTHLGYTGKEFNARFGEKFINLVHPEDRASLIRMIDEALTQGDEYEVRHRILTKNDGARWVIQRGRRTREATEPALLMSVFTDVTEIINLQTDLTTQARELEESLEVQMRQERRLQAAVAAAHEASRAKSTFLATMSHEIRTPMNGVIGFAELALEDPSLSARTRDYIGKIKQSADGLLGVINDILDISKIESGRMEAERIPFRINEVLQQCGSLMSMRAVEKGVSLVVDSDLDVETELLGDPTKLRQVLLNLLSNAIKFTRKGTATLRLRSTELPSGGLKVVFEVVDTGIGMTQDEVGRIFKPFVQADNSTTRQFGGTGLGLAISKSYIEMMGGGLRVESCPGAGSRFSFAIEFEPATADAHAGGAEQMENSRPVFSGRVLVCEDNEMNREVIREHLSGCGLKSDMAPNGRVGVEMVMGQMDRGERYDLIFMDIYMPVMDGMDATREIQRLGVTTPIVALTANVMKQDVRQYREAGMNGFLGKPFVSKELWTCLTKFLRPVRWLPIEGEARPTPLAEGFDRTKAEALLTRLESLLRSGDALALDEVEAVRETLSPLGSEGFLLADQIDSYDFEDAIRTIRSLREALDK